MTSSKNKKPNFRVKHPYGYLVRSILLGIVLVLTAVLGSFTVNAIQPKKEVQAAATEGSWASYAATSWSGTGTSSSPFQINTPQRLARMINHVYSNSGGYGYYYMLTADIDLSGHYWPGIGVADPYSGSDEGYEPWYNSSGTDTGGVFCGTFLGNGYKIKGLVLGDGDSDGDIDGRGLFNSSFNAQIYDVILDKPHVVGTNSSCAGFVAIAVETSFYNCMVTGKFDGYGTEDNFNLAYQYTTTQYSDDESYPIIAGTGSWGVGAFVGEGENLTFYNCKNSIAVFTTRNSAGGFVGRLHGTDSLLIRTDSVPDRTLIYYSYSHGSVTASITGDSTNQIHLGGFIGTNYTGDAVDFTGCGSTGAVVSFKKQASSTAAMPTTSTSNVGGFVGYDSSSSPAQYSYCYRLSWSQMEVDYITSGEVLMTYDGTYDSYYRIIVVFNNGHMANIEVNYDAL